MTAEEENVRLRRQLADLKELSALSYNALLAERDALLADLKTVRSQARALAESAIAYDRSIYGRAARGEVDLLANGGGIATGDDLDALYEDWLTKALAIMADL